MSAYVENSLTLASVIADIYIQFYDDPDKVSNDELLFACLFDPWNAASYFEALKKRSYETPGDCSLSDTITLIEQRLRKGTLTFHTTPKLAA